MVDLGTLSHGTLRDRDLLPCFADELERLTLAGIEAGTLPGRDAFEHFHTIRDAREMVDELDKLELDEVRTNDPDYVDAVQRSGDIVQSLCDALECFAPPFCYFGAHEGDGSDFGFWPMVDAIEDAEPGEVIKADCVPKFVAVVSDHGNVTLYRVTADEVWSVV